MQNQGLTESRSKAGRLTSPVSAETYPQDRANTLPYRAFRVRALPDVGGGGHAGRTGRVFRLLDPNQDFPGTEKAAPRRGCGLKQDRDRDQAGVEAVAEIRRRVSRRRSRR